MADQTPPWGGPMINLNMLANMLAQMNAKPTAGPGQPPAQDTSAPTSTTSQSNGAPTSISDTEVHPKMLGLWQAFKILHQMYKETQ